MSKNAPDFSGPFKLVQNQLTKTEQRLRARKPEPDQDPWITSPAEPAGQNRPNLLVSRAELETNPMEKSTVVSPDIRQQREQRRNLTLKVLESNEAKFNRLFHRLQIAGDPRRKQDLADEALQLLFNNYKNTAI